jgi:DNA-binding response OmpR family regulator
MAKKKILVVDDSDTSLMMGLLVLKRAAYDVIIARDGAEGVEKAAAEKPDLILMDAVMPRVDGFAAARELRRRDDTRGIPVILLTSRNEADRRAAAAEPAASDSLTKPLEPEALLEKVRVHLGS